MLKTNILFRITRLDSPHLLGGAIGRLIVTEDDLCPARQRRNAANGILNVSLLVFAWNDDRYRKVFQRHWLWNRSRNDHLGHTELVQKWQACAKAIQKTGQQRQPLRQENNSICLKSFKTGQLQQ